MGRRCTLKGVYLGLLYLCHMYIILTIAENYRIVKIKGVI